MIDLWDSNNYIKKDSINTSDIQFCIKWAGNGVNRLFTGGHNNLIHAYDVTRLQEVANNHSSLKQNEKKFLEKKSSEDYLPITMDLLPIPDMNLIVSASFDSSLCLWTMDTL
mmetsp:Transcript_15424/g.26079  ORF Transcript_15424/g.26079 Transcript_15424/m.26079 type:complete len:112 (-) Transcript_15424:1929-2264(-)